MSVTKHRSTWKGERKQIGPRIPTDLFDAISEDAKTNGVSRGDWLVHLAARYYGRDDLDPVSDVKRDQAEFQMTG